MRIHMNIVKGLSMYITCLIYIAFYIVNIENQDMPESINESM